MEAAETAVRETSSCETSRGNRWAWLLFGFWVLLDFGLFYQFLQREVVWSYPPASDQLQYLYDAYLAHDAMLTEGPLRSLRHQFRDGWPGKRAQGVMLIPAEASLLYLVLGVSRTTAMIVNFLHFIALQVAVLLTLRWLSGKWNIALLGLGLLTCCLFPFAAAGGLYDFRLDFASFCLYGIVTCLMLRSGPFLHWRWSIAAGFVAGLLSCSRFIAMAYFGGILIATLGLLTLQAAWRWKQGRDLARIRRELWCLCGCGFVMSLMILPTLYTHRELIDKYYVRNHVSGPEKSVRATLEGLSSTLDHIKYYPHSVLKHHIGVTAAVMLVATLLIWTFQGFRGKRRDPDNSTLPLRLGRAVRYLLVCILVPIAVLTLDEAKSNVVVAVVATPIVLLAMLWVVRCQDRLRLKPHLIARTGWVTAIAVMATGLNLHVNQFSSRTRMSLERRQNESLVAAMDKIVDYTLANRDTNKRFQMPRVFADGVYDFANCGVVNVLGYEHRGEIINAKNGSGGRIFNVAREDCEKWVADSDFVILNMAETPTVAAFPFDQAMVKIRPHLRDYCAENLLELTRFTKRGQEFAVYTRDCMRLQGDEGGWITPSELSITVPPGTLNRMASVVLKGRWPQIPWDQAHKQTPRVAARLELPGQPPQELKTDLQTPNGRYHLTIFCPAQEADEPGVIRFQFDDYFVPAEVNTSKDTRQLVALSPDEIQMLPAKVTVAGAPGGKISEEGLKLTIPQGFLNIRSHVVLQGVWSGPDGDDTPRPQATLTVPGLDDAETLNATLAVVKGRYTLRVEWEPRQRPADGTVAVTFAPPKGSESAGGDQPKVVAEAPDDIQVAR